MAPGLGAERAWNAKLSPRIPQNEQSFTALTAAAGNVGKGSLKHYFGCIVERKKKAQVIVPAWMMFCPVQPQRHQTPLLQRGIQAENENFSRMQPRPRVNSTQGQLWSTAEAAAIGAQGHQGLLKGGISQEALCLWSQLTAPQLTIHREISSGGMAGNLETLPESSNLLQGAVAYFSDDKITE